MQQRTCELGLQAIEAEGDYQSAETAWRYENRKARLKDEIANLEMKLENAVKELVNLKRNPPMYHLFNWSA